MPRQQYDDFDDDELDLDFDEPRKKPKQSGSSLSAEQRAEVKEIVLEMILNYLPKIVSASAPKRGDRERYYDDVEDDVDDRRTGMREARARAKELLAEAPKPQKENNLNEILADDCGGDLDAVLELS